MVGERPARAEAKNNMTFIEQGRFCPHFRKFPNDVMTTLNRVAD